MRFRRNYEGKVVPDQEWPEQLDVHPGMLSPGIIPIRTEITFFPGTSEATTYVVDFQWPSSGQLSARRVAP